MTDLLQGKSVLVTGAGRNIGRSIALEMAAQGATVHVTDIDPKRLADVERALKTVSSASQGFLSDVSKLDHVEHLVEALDARRIALDVLVNNVGVQTGRTFADSDRAVWDDAFATNVVGPMHLTRLVSDRMAARGTGGSVLFLTSIHGRTVRRDPVYSASKAALGMAIRELAVELAPLRIRINGIAPGYVEEDAEGCPIPHAPTPLHATSIPPAYIGRAAVFLASEVVSAYTTGTILTVDSGLSLVNHLVGQRL